MTSRPHDDHAPGERPPSALPPIRPPSRWAIAVAVVCGVAPFWSVLVAHVWHGRHGPSGFIHYDMAYYVANGREIFERGNGIGYCNPYDPSPTAPVIYYHWLPWLFGVGVKLLRIDPGAWFSAIGIVAGLLCGLGTFRLVAAVLPARRCLVPLFLLVMWGGGLFTLAAVVTQLATTGGLVADVRRFDPMNGWWFLNWGRNLVFPTEAVYHALVAWAWAGVVRRRPAAAALPVVALAATHPFSGLQHLAIMLAWFSAAAVVPALWPPPPGRAPSAHLRGVRIWWAALAAAAVAFVVYYFVMLPAVPEHAAISRRWALDWVLSPAAMLLAYAPVACLAAARVTRDRRHWQPEKTFFLLAAGVSLALVKHDLFVAPRQPLHFTRGYVWMPLMLLGLPLVQSLAVALLRRTGPALGSLLIALAAVPAVLDNAAWLVTYCRNEGHDIRVAAADREVFAALERLDCRGVLLYAVPDRLIGNYLSATYTSVRPFVGHLHLTPDHDARLAAVQEWIASGRFAGLLDEVEILVLDRRTSYPLDEAAWEPLCETPHRTVLRRRARASPDRPAAARPRAEGETHRWQEPAPRAEPGRAWSRWPRALRDAAV